MAGLPESFQKGSVFLAMGCGESSQEIPATWNGQKEMDRLVGSFDAPRGVRDKRQIREAIDSASGAAASTSSLAL